MELLLSKNHLGHREIILGYPKIILDSWPSRQEFNLKQEESDILPQLNKQTIHSQ